jgi:hypothetical protein
VISPRSLLLAAAALLALGGLTGCEDAPDHKPRSMQAVLLSPDKPAAPVFMDAVTGLTVSLPRPAPGSDYVWEIVSNNVRVLLELSPLRPDPPVAIGTKATTSMTFYAAHPGHSTLRFVLVHPRDADAVPAAKCTLAVTVRDLD